MKLIREKGWLISWTSFTLFCVVRWVRKNNKHKNYKSSQNQEYKLRIRSKNKKRKVLLVFFIDNQSKYIKIKALDEHI